jgi:adenine deaminase
MGMIAPGRWADIVLVRDLEQFEADLVIARGQVIAEAGTLLVDLPEQVYPNWALKSVNLQHPLTAADFRLSANGTRITAAAANATGNSNATATANVIGVIENQAPTRHLRLAVDVVNGEVNPDTSRDLAKVALVERHRATGEVQVGLVQGFGFRHPCAVATTVAHDSHHMIVVGTDEESMAVAANHLAATGGGQVAVLRGQVIGEVNLPIAGLISNEPAAKVAEKAETVLAGFRACGCTLNNPNMQLSLLGLVVIPEMRISDKGLVDVNHFRILPVLE